MKIQRLLAVRLCSTVLLVVAVTAGGLGSASAAPRSEPLPPSPLSVLAKRAPTGLSVKTGQREALRLPTHVGSAAAAKADDEVTYLEVNPDCAPANGKAKPHASVYSSVKLKLDYVLTGAGGFSKTGTVKVKADHDKSLKLKAVPAGSYQLTLAVHGASDVVADASFDVLPCVTVATSCHAITFTNPAGNPAAYVTYLGHKKKQYFDLELAPGASRTVRADYSKVDYHVYGFSDDDFYVMLGEDTVKVKQKCSAAPAQPGQNAVQTFGEVGCSDGGPALALLGWTAQPSLKDLRYQVLDQQQKVVQEGSFKGGKDAEIALEPGTYTYRSFANNILQPFEEQGFTVLKCAEVTAKCRAIAVSNPNAAALEVYALNVDEDVEPVFSQTTVAGLTSATIAWTEPSAYVYVFAADDDPSSTFYSDALALDVSGELEDEGLQVPQDC